MSISFHYTTEYQQWLTNLKATIRHRQIKAAIKVNTELLLVYWELGTNILEKQRTTVWGEALIPQLAKDLAAAFPESKGFSRSNLFYVKKWVEFYSRPEIVQQLVGQLQPVNSQESKTPLQIVQQLVAQLPWGHNVVIIDKVKNAIEALFYIQQALKHNWSRNMLILHIESKLFERKGKAIQNFEHTLEKIQADLAKDTLKNPYNFDFLTMGNEAMEKDLENALAGHMQKFLVELGQGFAFVGRQYRLNVGGDEFFMDLLFYHLKLSCFVVVELKTVAFKPEFAGKLNFYLNVVNDVLKHATDQPSIGILLCKTPNKVIVEYALKNINSPLGISEYKLVESIPDNLKGDLPSIEDLESELGN